MKIFGSAFVALTVTTVMTTNQSIVLFDYTGPDAAREWTNVNDNVMGGVSEGKLRITDEDTLQFYGNLSLKNKRWLRLRSLTTQETRPERRRHLCRSPSG